MPQERIRSPLANSTALDGRKDVPKRLGALLALGVTIGLLAGCSLNEALQAGAVAGVDRAVDRLGIGKANGNGWRDALVTSGGMLLIYVLSHRFAWLRVFIESMKGKPKGKK